MGISLRIWFSWSRKPVKHSWYGESPLSFSQMIDAYINCCRTPSNNSGYFHIQTFSWCAFVIGPSNDFMIKSTSPAIVGSGEAQIPQSSQEISELGSVADEVLATVGYGGSKIGVPCWSFPWNFRSWTYRTIIETNTWKIGGKEVGRLLGYLDWCNLVLWLPFSTDSSLFVEKGLEILFIWISQKTKVWFVVKDLLGNLLRKDQPKTDLTLDLISLEFDL